MAKRRNGQNDGQNTNRKKINGDVEWDKKTMNKTIKRWNDDHSEMV